MKHITSLSILTACCTLLAVPARSATVIGMNFSEFWANPQVSDGTADGLSGWTDSWLVPEGNFSSNGTNASLNGSSSVKMTWNSSGLWNAGEESNNEQGLYRSFLDDGDVGDGLGVRVTITGLSAWLAAEGMSSYQIRAYNSTDTDGATFHTITIHDGPTTLGAVLGTISPVVLGDNDFPTGPFDQNWQSRGYGDSTNTLAADSITLTIPVRSNDVRGSLAALKITAVPEPSAAVLGSLALLGLLRRRRVR